MYVGIAGFVEQYSVPGLVDVSFFDDFYEDSTSNSWLPSFFFSNLGAIILCKGSILRHNRFNRLRPLMTSLNNETWLKGGQLAEEKLSWYFHYIIRHILITQSRRIQILCNMQFLFTASNYAGFGLMDAYGLVSLAVNWTTVAPQLTCTISYLHINRCVLCIILSGMLI